MTEITEFQLALVCLVFTLLGWGISLVAMWLADRAARRDHGGRK